MSQLSGVPPLKPSAEPQIFMSAVFFFTAKLGFFIFGERCSTKMPGECGTWPEGKEMALET